MEIKRGVYVCLVFALIFVLANQSAADYSEIVSGFSFGQPQILHKDRHLLAIDCNGSCGKRCALAGVKGRCLKYCGICCKECGCVPSGTYGNKGECPCYRDKKNAKGKSKCP